MINVGMGGEVGECDGKKGGEGVSAESGNTMTQVAGLAASGLWWENSPLGGVKCCQTHESMTKMIVRGWA